MNMITKIVISIRINSIAKRSTHQVFLCCSSEKLIDERPELSNLRGARATGVATPVTVNGAKYIDSCDICDNNSGVICVLFIPIIIVSKVVDSMIGDDHIYITLLFSSNLLSLSIVPLRILGCVLCKVDRAGVM